ncbi:LmeA family phospholipid-binding protein [Jatrophihabitans sp. YIM 134969]
MTAPVLRVVTPTSPTPGGAERLLTPSRAWTVGRAPDADVVVDDGLVSRHHLVLEPAGPGWTVRDVSSNGSWLNGGRIPPAGYGVPPGATAVVHLGAPTGPAITLGGAPGGFPGDRTAGPAFTPARPARRRRRGLRGLVIALVVLAVLLVVGDRVAAAVAGDQAVKQIVQQSQGLTSEPSVSFRGFPFLTQVASGTYSDIRVRVRDIAAPDAPRIASIEADLRGAHVPLSSVLDNTLSSVPVDRVDATVRLGFDDLNAYLADQVGGLVLKPTGNGAIAVSGTVDLDGSTVSITGTATVGARDGGLLVTPGDVQVQGGDLGPLADLASGLGSLLPPIPVPLDGLPFDLAVTSVDVDADGITGSAQARGVTLEVPQ